MSITSFLYSLLRLSRDANAIKRGPKAVSKRAVRKVAYRATGELLRKLLG